MGLIKEYQDRAIQTEAVSLPSPYADPAVILAAPSRRSLAQVTHTAGHGSIPASSPAGSDGAYDPPSSPTSPMLAPLVSRRVSKRKHARCPEDIVNRRIVSMPENKSEGLSHSCGKRVVSMPDRVRPMLGPSAEPFQSPSTSPGDSFGSYGSRHERIRIFHAPSDVPHTPSPPSSPESLLIIATGAQLPEGFLRKKYSPEPLIEEDEDWITWANSPPRPIPALHGPLSLPYARCPSGAEGTIIEEPDNVAQMIWGLGPADQSHNQVHTESPPSRHDSPQNPLSHAPSHAIPRLQKKRTGAPQQIPKSSRTQGSHGSLGKHGFVRPQRQTPDDKRNSLSQNSPDIESCRDVAPWNEDQSIPANPEVPDSFLNDADLFPVDNSPLEWQLSRIRRAIRTSLTEMDSYTTYPGRLEPVIPASVASGLPQSYPRIFVEPRPNESVSSATRQSPTEISLQYCQQRLYRQALQKQKLQIQNLLPTPPNSSSPQWSSHFSPYLTYGSTFSSELAGSTDHLVPTSSQKYWTGANASQQHRYVYDRHEHEAHNFDTSSNVSSAQIPRTALNATSAPSLRQRSSSSSTLAKYIKQLQALSPTARFSPLQPDPTSGASLPSLSSTDESICPFRTVYRSPVIPMPPSPESPQTLSRGSSCHGIYSVAPTHTGQRLLPSVPEEDSTFLELSTSVSPSRLHSLTTDNISSSHGGLTGHQIRYVDATPEQAIVDLPGFEGGSHETSPVKVRLPVTKEQNIREQSNSGHQHVHRKKHRPKKSKGPTAPHEQAAIRGLVG